MRSKLDISSQVSIMPALTKRVGQVLEAEGMDALAMPKRTAAVHEAGHAIVLAAQGERVRSCRIKSRKYAGKLYWGGLTFGGNPWICGPDSSFETDLRRMQIILAGVCAEFLFDRENYRSGSSLDEIIMAQGIAEIATLKMPGVSAERIYSAQLEATQVILCRYDTELIALADALERKEWIHRGQMDALLETVRGAE